MRMRLGVADAFIEKPRVHIVIALEPPRAFSFFRGACTRGIYDNMKTAVIFDAD
jgi:hypothetical protein